MLMRYGQFTHARHEIRVNAIIQLNRGNVSICQDWVFRFRILRKFP